MKGIKPMSNLTQNLVNPNTQPLVIGDAVIRQDQDGRYCLNDLHKVSGNLAKHKPSFWLRNEQTQDLISELQNSNSLFAAIDHPVNVLRGNFSGDIKQGTYVVKELVYAYAMWISAKFHLTVIRAYDAMVMEWMVGGKQTISPEQCGILYNIVHTRAGGNQGLIKQMWSRLKNHFKYSASYRELRAIHFEDAKHYLELMELKVSSKQPEVKALPYPQEIIQIAEQINQEFKNSRYDSWHVSARNGVLTAMPLPPGFYPTMNIAEFTKRFDSVLDLLYGTDTLRVGRYMLAEMNKNP